MRITGEVWIGEAAAQGARVVGRLTGAPWSTIWMLGGGLAAGVGVVAVAQVFKAAARSILGDGLSEGAALAFTLVLLIIAVMLVVRVCRGVGVRAFRKSLVARGLSNPFSATFEITDDAFVCLSDGMTYRAAWTVVTEVVLLEPYWFMIAQGQPLVVPRRFFSDDTAERQFIGAIVQRLTSDARGRSPQATAFAQS